ncbi:MAG: winged helix-turn-helix domain-containing protein [Clostridiales Family XIII bacterium]|jgi:DNA-binding SARP family transcriptional activator|nr:winged helix-turn-helix domain-containing protein [Clostridiales Family XIII bacterium]
MPVKNKGRRFKREKSLEAHVTTLGGFELRIGNVKADESLNRSNKMWALLAYLILRRDRNVPQSELIDLLWPDDKSSNPINALKTLLYRTRMSLAPVLGQDIKLVLSRRGSYMWNPEIKCAVDVEDLETLCGELENAALSEEQRLEICRQIANLYKGDFLPKLSEMIWVVTNSAHCHALYLNAIRRYSDMLVEMEHWSELNSLCTKALDIDPFDERLHALLITSLIRQGNSTAALGHYETATDFLYKNLGVRPSESLRSLYIEIMNHNRIYDADTDMDTLLENLREAANEPGAFICDPGFFKLAYRLEARRTTRNGSSVHIALLTITAPDNSAPPLRLLNAAMNHLLEAIKLGLRKGDVASRYSGAQYVLMLPTANFEDGQVVVNRILRLFMKQHPRNRLKISPRLFQLELAK